MKGDVCKVDGCNRIIKEYRSVCGSCRMRKIKYGSYTGKPKPRIKKTIEERFFPNINKTDSCWLWGGMITSKGYGHIWTGKVTRFAHRVSWELHNGKISDGLHVLHKCDNPPCVNPDHLFLGTHQDNMNDMVNKGRNNRNPPRGSKHWKAKLTEKKVAKIRNLLNHGCSSVYIVKKYNLSSSTVCQIKHNRTWSHINV